MRKFPAVIALWILLPAPSFSQSGNELIQACKSDRSAGEFLIGECAGIIEAVLYYGKSLPGGLSFCAPLTTTNGQARAVVVAYMNAHPERLDEHAAELAAEALHSVWPCDNKASYSLDLNSKY
jgi:hypothetical protein